jgi:hypothetical protein
MFRRLFKRIKRHQHKWEVSERQAISDGCRRALFVTFVCHCGAVKREARLGYSHYPDAGCFTAFDLGDGRMTRLEDQSEKLSPIQRHQCGNVKQIM